MAVNLIPVYNICCDCDAVRKAYPSAYTKTETVYLFGTVTKMIF